MKRRWVLATAIVIGAVVLGAWLGRAGPAEPTVGAGPEGPKPVQPDRPIPIPAASESTAALQPKGATEPAAPARGTATPVAGTDVRKTAPAQLPVQPGGQKADSAPAAQGQQEPPTFETDRDGIREAMEMARQDIGECYQAWVKVNPEIAGKVSVHYVISAGDGRIREVSLESGLHQTALEGCIVSAVRELHFTPPDADKQVTFPFTFAAR